MFRRHLSMKYYVVPKHALSFKEEGEVIIPSQEAIKANLLEMFANDDQDNDAMIAFTRRADAEKVANEFDSERKDHEGFAVIEIAAPKKEYNQDTVKIDVANGKTEKIKGVLIPYAKMTFVKAHLGHLDVSLKRETVVINEKGSDLIAQASKPVVVEQPTVESATKDAEKTKGKVSTSFSIKSFAMGLLATAAFGAAAYAAMISGVTPALLAYFGVKAGFAATLAASAGLVAATSAVAYATVRVAISFVKFVASKFRGSKAEETATEKPAEDAPKDSKEIPDCCKAKCEVTAEAKKEASADASAKTSEEKSPEEEAVNTKAAKVLLFAANNKKPEPVVTDKTAEEAAKVSLTMRK